MKRFVLLLFFILSLSCTFAQAQTGADIQGFISPLRINLGGTGTTQAPTDGQLLIGNTSIGYTIGSLTGTTNQVIVTPGSGSVTLSLPQNVNPDGIAVTNITQIANRSHTNLSSIGTNTHAQIDNVLSKYVVASDYGTLALADNAAVSLGRTLLVNGNYTLSENTALASHVYIMKGYMITTTGYTLSFTGSLQAGYYQVFSGTGSVVGLSESIPEWWGTGTYAMQSALDSLTNGGNCYLGVGTYTISNITITNDNVSLIGSGWGSIINTTASIAVSTAPIIWVQANNVTLKDFKTTWETSPDHLVATVIAQSDNVINYGWYYSEGGAIPTPGNIVIQGGLVDHVYVYEGKCHGIMIGRSSNVTVQNSRVDKVWGTGVTSVGASNFNILNNYITLGHDASIDPNQDASRLININTATHEPVLLDYVYGETSGTRLWIDHATLTSGAWDGSGVGTILYAGGIWTKDGLIVGEHLHESPSGAGQLVAIVASVEQPVYGPEIYPRNIIIKGNTVYKNAAGIGIHGADGVLLDSNIIDGTWADPITSQSSTFYGLPMSWNVTISNNIIRNGMRWYKNDPFGADDAYATLDHATTVSGYTAGMNIQIFGNLVINGNNIYDDSGLVGSQYGMLVTSDNIVISNNSMTQDWPAVIYLSASNPNPPVDSTQNGSLLITGNNIKVNSPDGYYGVLLLSVNKGIITGNIFDLGQTGSASKTALYAWFANDIMVTGNVFKNFVTEVTDAGSNNNLFVKDNLGFLAWTRGYYSNWTYLGDSTHAINTVNKYPGKMVWDQVNGYYWTASGATPTAPWYVGTTAITPAP